MYKDNESYIHKCAKNVLMEWAKDEELKFTDGIYEWSWWWRSNRTDPFFLEYPIIVNDEIDTVSQNVDELIHYGSSYSDGICPTFEECKKNNMFPSAIVDVVASHKGTPLYFIEICHKNPVSHKKLKNLIKCGVRDLIEIDAYWILKQTKKPDIIQVKNILILEGDPLPTCKYGFDIKKMDFKEEFEEEFVKNPPHPCHACNGYGAYIGCSLCEANATFN